MRVDVEETLEAFTSAAARAFVDTALESIAARGRFVVALTGGSSPIPIHTALATTFRDRVQWDLVDVVFGDERAVPPEHELSNYRAARESLLQHVPSRVFRMEGERADLASAARDYEKQLMELCGGEIDLMFVGIGKDAHILSLFPGSPHLASATLVEASIDPPMNPAVSRITMTPVAVSRARRVVAIATGADKRPAIEKLVHDTTDEARVPAHVLRRASDARLIVDRAASA
jgi:6-phosphogluconolactonase